MLFVGIEGYCNSGLVCVGRVGHVLGSALLEEPLVFQLWKPLGNKMFFEWGWGDVICIFLCAGDEYISPEKNPSSCESIR
jgi:hypothetical protein